MFKCKFVLCLNGFSLLCSSCSLLLALSFLVFNFLIQKCFNFLFLSVACSRFVFDFEKLYKVLFSCKYSCNRFY